MTKKPPAEVPVDLPLEQKQKLVAWIRERQAEYGDFDWIKGPRELRREVDDCLGWHAAKGNPGKYHDWLAVCRRWMVKAQKIRETDRQRGKRESFVDLEAPVRLRVVK